MYSIWVELHWFPGTCSRVTLIALEEIGAPFETVVVDLPGGEHLRPPYQRLNPKGKVPTLVVDGHPYTENTAILTMLHRRHPAARLLPGPDLAEEIEALSLMSWFAAGVHPSITRFRFPQAICRLQTSFDDVRDVARTQLDGAFSILERRLVDREWLFSSWSVVDGYMLWLWFRAVGSGLDPSPYPRCADHARRTEGRPAVARALDREERDWKAVEANLDAAVSFPPNQAGRIRSPQS